MSGTITTLQAAALWGIESDSGDDYLAEVYREECEVLADMIRELGSEVVGEA